MEYKTFEKNLTKTEFKPKHELIGTHTARKTFINLAYDNGLDVEMIKSITGITHERTLRRYLNVSTDAKKDKLMKAFQTLSIHSEPEIQTILDASILLDQIKQGAKEAFEIKAGKQKGSPLSNLLTEL